MTFFFYLLQYSVRCFRNVLLLFAEHKLTSQQTVVHIRVKHNAGNERPFVLQGDSTNATYSSLEVRYSAL